MTRRWQACALAVTIALVGSATIFAQKKEEKRDGAQKKEIQLAVKLADDIAAGQPAANDLGLAWAHEDFMKAAGNKDYVPFTVTLDPSKFSGSNLVLYWRVVAKTAPAPAPAVPAGKKDNNKESKDSKDAAPKSAYEDVSFLPLTPAAAQRVSRSFTVPAGAYDVFVVAKEATPTQKNAPAAKVSVIKETVTVPDFWNGDLNTSSLIMAQRIDPLPTPLTQQQQVERPYAMGQMEIVPAVDTKFSKKAELSTFMLIYNPKTDSGSKPDVSVEYNFYVKSGGTEKFFNKTNPQNLNRQTLPPDFDTNAGHQLQTGQAVPLASFPEGDYRLEIKVTDKIANKSITRDVNFTVTAS
jgi:hypothetical protein